MTAIAAALSPSRLVFYGTSATVIPVFMLAMAVQLRAKRVFSSFVGEGRWGRKALPLIAWIFLVANGGGEVASLMTLYYNSDDHTSAVLVFISVLVSAVLVLLGAADLLYGQVSERSGPLASDTAPLRSPRRPPSRPYPRKAPPQRRRTRPNLPANSQPTVTSAGTLSTLRRASLIMASRSGHRSAPIASMTCA